MKINIITPCTRPQNLQKIYKSIKFKFFAWYIVFDTSKVDLNSNQDIITKLNKIQNVFTLDIPGGISGNSQRNFALDHIKEGYCYFLDDDNLLYHNFYNVLTSIHKTHNKKIYTFNQLMPNGRIRKGNVIKVTHIDQAQYIIDSSLLKDLRFEQTYFADGILIEHLYNTNKEDFYIIDEVLCYYNWLIEQNKKNLKRPRFY